MLQLASMLATGKIENMPTKDGSESLRIDESKAHPNVVNDDSESLRLDDSRTYSDDESLRAESQQGRRQSMTMDEAYAYQGSESAGIFKVILKLIESNESLNTTLTKIREKMKI